MTAYRVEIIAVGTELLLGNVANTDAQFLSEMLASVGVDVLYHTAVGDNPARLREVVDIAQLEATPTPEPAVNYNTLSKGDKSDEVLQMQNRLYELGYLNDDRDGAFGTKTQTAVKMFQQVAGLPITGIADSDTLNALYAADAPRPDTAPTPTAEAAPSPTPEVTPEPTVEAAQ